MLSGQCGQRLEFNNSLSEYLNDNTTEDGRIKDMSKHNPIIEYEVKLKNIPNKLYAKKAKEIGENRIEFMEQYFNRLKSELQ